MEKFNVLLCIDDFKWDYARHCAVTILSLLETNKKHKIKIFIMSSCLPEENIEELKRIVKLYNQEIEFIIRDDLIPEEIKKSVINRRNLTWGTWYRLFFPYYIKNIDRLLYMDCDVLVTKDILDIYNMDMEWKAIAGHYEPEQARYLKKKYFWLGNYVNAWVLLFDAKKYDLTKINTWNIKKLNKQYWKWINDSDQDYLNLIFADDIIVKDEWMNFILERPFCNPWYEDASILHCLAKPYAQYSLSPKKIRKLYDYYLQKTKWKDVPKEKPFGLIWYIITIIYWAIFVVLRKIFWVRAVSMLFNLFHKMSNVKGQISQIKKSR